MIALLVGDNIICEVWMVRRDGYTYNYSNGEINLSITYNISFLRAKNNKTPSYISNDKVLYSAVIKN